MDSCKPKGKLYVLEGIDGSGKTTQYERLLSLSAEKGKALCGTSFPNYNSNSGRLISQYLQGDFGTEPGDVNAYAAASLFAVDRFASFKTDPWGKALADGRDVLSARYTTSNAIHQCSKLPEEQWIPFFKWLSEYEYTYLGLPRPELVCFLDLPSQVALDYIKSRSEKTGVTRDIHEKNTSYLLRCTSAAEAAADYFGWIRIPVTENGKMLAPDLITLKLSRFLGL